MYSTTKIVDLPGHISVKKFAALGLHKINVCHQLAPGKQDT